MDNKELKAAEHEEEEEKTITASEELKMYVLEIIVDILNNIEENTQSCAYEFVEAHARAVKHLAEAYATIVKCDKEVNIYEVIKTLYGTGIKGDT